jgi:hypothetical protein
MKVLGYLAEAAVMVLVLPFMALVGLALLAARALDYLELHTIYDGNADEQSKANWH